jgi:Protein of unknown function (DUF3800)
MSSRTGRAILDKLATPGRVLVFIDDSGTPEKPLPDLAEDFELICGIVIMSESYADVRKQLLAELRAIGNGVTEFHAAEIVNAPRSSPWQTVSLATRYDALRKLIAILKDTVSVVFHCFVSGEQYNAELKHKASVSGIQPLETEKALRHVFFNNLIPFLQTTGQKTAIVVDSSKELSSAIRIQRAAEPPSFYEGGVIYVDSRHEPGVQLADIAAYIMNRVHHVRQRLLDGKRGPFDELVINAAFDLSSKFVNVLDPAPSARFEANINNRFSLS